MEARSSSETPVDIYRIAMLYIAEDIALPNRRCENLKTCISTKGPRLTSQQNKTLLSHLWPYVKHVAEKILIPQQSLV
jgi:hypothetical protein